VRTPLVLMAALILPMPAFAHPAQIIIARHTEKADDYALCAMGTERAQALAQQYLGRGASNSLFAEGRTPAALLAITLHTLESITPVAQSWHMPVTAYPVDPASSDKEVEENRRTQEAAHAVLTDPRYAGKTVLMMWEHKRIASADLEKEFAGQEVTLRQLLHLDRIANVPETWPEQTYDYFWIVNFMKGNALPVSLRMVRQEFAAPFNDLPANLWGEPEPRHIGAGCLK
jgi:hypothetical protein